MLARDGAWRAHAPYWLLVAGALGAYFTLAARGRLDWVVDGVADPSSTLPLGVALAVAWLGYAGIVLGRRDVPHGVEAAYAIATVFLFLITPATLSIDLLDYIRRGRILSVYGANPHLVAPAAFPNDPFFSSAGWTFFTSPYGPLFTILSGALTRVAGESPLAGILLFKGTMTAAHLLNSALIRTLAGRRAARAYLYNPFILLEVVANAHNDVLPACAVLLSILCLQRGAAVWSAVLLSAAACFKLPFVFLLPVWLRHAAEARDGRAWRTAALGTLLSALTAAALWAPFLSSTSVFHVYRLHAAMQTKWSLPGVLRDLLLSAGVPLAAAVATYVCAAVGAAAALPAIWRARDFDNTVRAYATVLLFLPLAGMGWVFPWYFVWPLAVMPLVSGNAWRLAAVALSGSGLLHYVQLTRLDFASTLGENIVLSLTTIAPALMVLLLYDRAFRWLHSSTPATRHIS